MPFEFPTAPAAGTIHSEFGVEYVWDGTVWNLQTGGDMTDYVLKAGDTMTGPLVLDATGLQFTNSLGASNSDMTKGITFATGYGIAMSPNLLNYHVAAAGQHKFYVDGVEKARIETSNAFIGQGHIRAQGGGAFAFDRTADNQPGIYFMAAQIRSKGGGSEGQFEFWTDNGGWSSVSCFRTTLASGVAGIYVYNDCSAVSFTDRGMAHTKHDIRDCIDTEVSAAWAALKPKRFRKNLPEEKGEWPQPAPKLRFGFVADDLLADEATKDIVTMAYVPETNGLQYEPEGTDIMQVLALTVAKVKQLEAEIAALKTAQPRNPSPPPVLPRRR